MILSIRLENKTVGYTTDFYGSFDIDIIVSEDHAKYINKFCQTRRMKRDPAIAVKLDDNLRKNVGLSIGRQGEYYVGEDQYALQHDDGSVLSINSPPDTQPGLWCQWTINEDRTKLEWDGGEKFYNYIEWLQYVINNFLGPWGYTLSGTIKFQGEDPDDQGEITVINNIIGPETYPDLY